MEIFLVMLTQELKHLQLQDYHTEAELSGYIRCSMKLVSDKNEDYQSKDILSRIFLRSQQLQLCIISI